MLDKRVGRTRWTVVVVLFVVAAIVGVAIRGRGRGPRRPHVVFISIDSLRADHLSCYGAKRLTSPNLDRLAAEGSRVATVVAESSWTLPTHATMLTGLAQTVHGLGVGGRLSDNVVTLTELLRADGYRTHGIWSGPYLHPYFGLNQGFDAYESVMQISAGTDATYDAADATGKNVIGPLHRQSYAERTSAEIVDRAVLALESADDRPLFLFLHFFDVHYDYDPPEESWRPFDPKYAGELDASNWMSNAAVHVKMNETDLRHVAALYDGEIAYTDHHIGRLLEALDERGLASDTLVMVTSDHGDEFFEHGQKGHRNSLYDEVLLVPWIVRWPGVVKKAAVVEAQARHVDLMPTLLDFVGLDPPYALQGDSFAPALRGEATAASLPAVSRLLLASAEVGEWESLRLDRTKYIRVRNAARVEERVYDILKDRREHAPLEGPQAEESKALARRRLDTLRDAESRLREALKTSGTTQGALPKEVEAELRQLGYLK
ncbi:MAG: sulfatase [Planctomycetes bacterium]|nr:sulfatase [Planctomycetota bacterium]